MIERILTVLVSVPILFACTYAGGPSFFVLVGVLAMISLNEFYNMLKAKGLNPYYFIGNLFTLLMLILVQFDVRHALVDSASSLLLTSAIIVTFGAAVLIRRSSMSTANIAITVLGMLYVGWLFSYLISLRALTPHGKYLFMLMFAIWALDTTAYFIGKTFGKKQLSPFISPKKTVEGGVAGFIASVAVVYAFGMYFENALVPAQWVHYVVLGVIVGMLAQISDLSESLIKRDTGVKDSSKLVPGHGGVLDRMDSFIFTTPVVYYYVTFFLQR